MSEINNTFDDFNSRLVTVEAKIRELKGVIAETIQK